MKSSKINEYKNMTVEQLQKELKELKNELELAELRVQNLQLKVDKLEYEFESYKEEVKKQIKKHKTQKIWWGLAGIAVGVLIGHSV